MRQGDFLEFPKFQLSHLGEVPKAEGVAFAVALWENILIELRKYNLTVGIISLFYISPCNGKKQ